MCVAVLATTTMAAAPKLMSYQGRATDASGNPVADGPHSVRFDLYNNATAGSSLWNETASVTTSGGLFTHTMGSVIPILESQFRYYEGLWLQVTFDGQVQTPRTQFTSVGYAFHVQSIHNADGGRINGYLAIYDNTAGDEIAELYGDANGEPVLNLNGSLRDILLNTGDSASNSVVLPQNAIESSEIKDEPGVGSNILDSVVLPSGHPYPICGRTMIAPANGYVLVTATASLSINHNTATTGWCSFGVADNNMNWVESARVQVYFPANAALGLYMFPIASHALFPISKGSKAYYFLGEQHSGGTAIVHNVQLTEVFIPTAYTTVIPPVPPLGAAGVLSTPSDPESERLEAETFHNSRMQAELDKMKVELNAIRQKMRDMKD